MRIELDTKTKTILLLENINIEELLVELEALDIDFMEWSLVTERPTVYVYPWMTSTGTTNSATLNDCCTNQH